MHHLTFYLILLSLVGSSIFGKCWVYWMRVVGRDFWESIFTIHNSSWYYCFAIFLYSSSWFCPHLCACAKLWFTTRQNTDVHEFQCVETTFTLVHFIQFFFWKNLCILFLSHLFLWIISNLTQLHHDLVYLGNMLEFWAFYVIGGNQYN
jgi:hypothetical protein